MATEETDVDEKPGEVGETQSQVASRRCSRTREAIRANWNKRRNSIAHRKPERLELAKRAEEKLEHSAKLNRTWRARARYEFE